jgi:protein SCO1/2/putative membrane protein
VNSANHLQDRLLWGLLVVVGLGVIGWAAWSAAAESSTLPTVAPFHLVERSGRTITNADLKGKVWIAGCTFTCCTMSCPKIVEAMSLIHEEIRGTGVYLVNFSVDPEHDTPARLNQYASALGVDSREWLFLTGKSDEIFALIDRSFQTRPQRNPDPNAEAGLRVAHTSRLFLIDHHGRVRGSYSCVENELGPDNQMSNQFHIDEVERQRLVHDAHALAQGPLGPAIQLTWLPTVNAALNATSAVLITVGYSFIRRRRMKPHVFCMLGAVLISSLFLTSYLYYHYFHGATPFPGSGWTRPVYFSILISHTILAALVAPMVLTTLFFALRGQFQRHRRIARWTLPIWLYVSVTGVVVYWFLYHFATSAV